MIEKLFRLIADHNRLASPEDELSHLIKSLDDSCDEMDEWMLEHVTAAKLEVKQTSEKEYNE